MKKVHFFLLISLPLVFLSCFDRKNDVPGTDGALNHISVIIDDDLWSGEIGDSIRNKFASPVIGLPEEEPQFTINQYPAKLMEGFMTDSRTVLVVKKEPSKTFRIRKNEFGSGQTVVHISGPTVAEILQILEQHASEIIEIIHEGEIAEMMRRIDTALADIPEVPKLFGVRLHIPESFKLAYQGEKFLWLKKDIISGNQSILLYEIPLGSIGKEMVSDIRRIRDSIGAKYIHGTAPESRMITENAYAPYMSQLMIGGRKCYETRGTWELENDFMRGPFLNHAIIDQPGNRILMLEGFSYAPSKQTRDLMFELETIIHSLSFDK